MSEGHMTLHYKHLEGGGAFVPVVVGGEVVLGLRSGLVGLAEAGGVLGFRTGSLSVCFRLFTLSGGESKTDDVTSHQAEQRCDWTVRRSPVSPGFPTWLGLLLRGMDGRAGDPGAHTPT